MQFIENGGGWKGKSLEASCGCFSILVKDLQLPIENLDFKVMPGGCMFCSIFSMPKYIHRYISISHFSLTQFVNGCGFPAQQHWDIHVLKGMFCHSQ